MNWKRRKVKALKFPETLHRSILAELSSLGVNVKRISCGGFKELLSTQVKLLQYAQKLFDENPERDKMTLTTTNQCGCITRAAELFDVMGSRDVSAKNDMKEAATDPFTTSESTNQLGKIDVLETLHVLEEMLARKTQFQIAEITEDSTLAKFVTFASTIISLMGCVSMIIGSNIIIDFDEVKSTKYKSCSSSFDAAPIDKHQCSNQPINVRLTCTTASSFYNITVGFDIEDLIGFVMYSEYYKSHVQYGGALALAITGARIGLSEALALIKPLVSSVFMGITLIEVYWQMEMLQNDAKVFGKRPDEKLVIWNMIPTYVLEDKKDLHVKKVQRIVFYLEKKQATLEVYLYGNIIFLVDLAQFISKNAIWLNEKVKIQTEIRKKMEFAKWVEMEMLTQLHRCIHIAFRVAYSSGDFSHNLLCYELMPNVSLKAWFSTLMSIAHREPYNELEEHLSSDIFKTGVRDSILNLLWNKFDRDVVCMGAFEYKGLAEEASFGECIKNKRAQICAFLELPLRHSKLCIEFGVKSPLNVLFYRPHGSGEALITEAIIIATCANFFQPCSVANGVQTSWNGSKQPSESLCRSRKA